MAPCARWNIPDGTAARCEHVDDTRTVSPRSMTCEQCTTDGLTWAALRLCMTCGWVACSDESPGRHAQDHYEETDHAVVGPAEPGSTWRWCYVHNRAV